MHVGTARSRPFSLCRSGAVVHFTRSVYPSRVVILSEAKDLLFAYAGEVSRDHRYFVYIAANRSRTLYIGVTNNLVRRMGEHRTGAFEGFTAKYRIHRLVHFERFQYVGNAIAREKQLKGWLRARKIALIEESNPTWQDLYLELARHSEQKAGPSLRSG